MRDFDFHPREYETKIYAVRMPEGKKSWCGEDTSCWVRLKMDCIGKNYRPGTNDPEISKFIEDNVRWSDLETARLKLDELAERFNLKLIHTFPQEDAQ
jgi:hypothetical protein